jgi:hypothetical protein
MSKKAMITGFAGEKPYEKLKSKITNAVKTAIEDYGVTDFYFVNNLDETEPEDNPILKETLSNGVEAAEFIAKTIKDYKTKNKNESINSAILVARLTDENYDTALYDEIIQGYSIYANELDFEQSSDAFQLRDNFIASNIDILFWYSNKILENTSHIFMSAKANNKIIVYL